MTIIEIDGSYGEGGGQLVRSALSLSAILKKPFTIRNIRLTRKPKPHLRPQHLMAVQAVAKITSGELQNARLGSETFTFYPGQIQAGEYEFDIGTAGSAILVAQTLIPILLYAKAESRLRIIGGTHLHQSPSYDFFKHVFLNALNLFDAHIDASLIRSGYYPAGGGIIEIQIHPAKLKGNTVWQTQNKNTQAIIRIANLPFHIAEREKLILENHDINEITIEEEHTLSPGNTVTIWQGYKGSTALGIRGKRAEIVAMDAIENFQMETAEIDCHLADQLLIYASLAKGCSRYTTSRISQHVISNAYVISHFIDRNITFDNTSVHID